MSEEGGGGEEGAHPVYRAFDTEDSASRFSRFVSHGFIDRPILSKERKKKGGEGKRALRAFLGVGLHTPISIDARTLARRYLCIVDEDRAHTRALLGRNVRVHKYFVHVRFE